MRRRPFFWSIATVGKHTQGADWSAWLTSGSLPSFERTVDLPLCLSNQWITAFCPKLQTYIYFQVSCGSMNILFASCIFCLWLVIWTDIPPFFSGNLLILSVNGNICHSIHRQYIIFCAILLYLLFLETHFVDVILRLHWICLLHRRQLS